MISDNLYTVNYEYNTHACSVCPTIPASFVCFSFLKVLLPPDQAGNVKVGEP